MFDLSIVAPVYNEEKVLPLFFKEIKKVVTQLQKSGVNTEVIYVNDGSKDKSPQLLEKHASAVGFPVRVVHFTRNFGHQAALSAGYKLAKGRYIATIDSDLQDPPSLIPKFYRIATSRGVDVVVGQRISRQDSFLKRLTAKVFYRILNKLAYVPIMEEVADFRLVSARVRDNMLRINEHPRFFRGLVSFLGYPTYVFRYKRNARARGVSKYSLAKMFRLALVGLLNYSTKLPLLFLMWASFAVIAVTLFYSIGYLPAFYGGVILLFLVGLPLGWLVLEYLANILLYLQHKPEYVINYVYKNSAYESLANKRRET